jgi:hypothetical protein
MYMIQIQHSAVANLQNTFMFATGPSRTAFWFSTGKMRGRKGRLKDECSPVLADLMGEVAFMILSVRRYCLAETS